MRIMKSRSWLGLGLMILVYINIFSFQYIRPVAFLSTNRVKSFKWCNMHEFRTSGLWVVFTAESVFTFQRIPNSVDGMKINQFLSPMFNALVQCSVCLFIKLADPNFSFPLIGPKRKVFSHWLRQTAGRHCIEHYDIDTNSIFGTLNFRGKQNSLEFPLKAVHIHSRIS